MKMLEPYKGRVFDPCCGSGGMFVQSEKFIKEHQGKINDISIYGQESNQTTWRLAKMNLAIRGLDSSQVKWNSEGSFLKCRSAVGLSPPSPRPDYRPPGFPVQSLTRNAESRSLHQVSLGELSCRITRP